MASASTSAGLNNDRGIGGSDCRHGRQALLHVVDIKGWDAIAMLGRMVEQTGEG
jgi:hypothetical protein